MRVVVDKAGRIVIPKTVRERWRLTAGTELELAETPAGIELLVPDSRPEAVVTEEDGFLVLDAPVGPESIDDTLTQRDDLREPRHR